MLHEINGKMETNRGTASLLRMWPNPGSSEDKVQLLQVGITEIVIPCYENMQQQQPYYKCSRNLQIMPLTLQDLQFWSFNSVLREEETKCSTFSTKISLSWEEKENMMQPENLPSVHGSDYCYSGSG